MTSALQTNFSKKHFKEGDKCVIHYYIRIAVPQFNIRGSNAADYKRTDVAYGVLFVFG